MIENSTEASFERREDIVISVCLPETSVVDQSFNKFNALVRMLNTKFRFLEIIIVNEAGSESFLPRMHGLDNMRLLEVQPGSSYYLKRVLAADEALGDIVLIIDIDEVTGSEALQMIDEALKSNGSVIAQRKLPDKGSRFLSLLLTMVGRVAGFLVDNNTLRTIAFPRAHLNQFLLHYDPTLALRFPPQTPAFTISFFDCSGEVTTRTSRYEFKQRLELLNKLFVYMAPSLLVFVSLSALVLVILGILYGLYTLGAWIVLDKLALGWFTTSVMLSVTAIFMGLSILGISLGLQYILNQNKKTSRTSLVRDVNHFDLFNKVGSDLNVEIDNRRSEVPRRDPPS